MTLAKWSRSFPSSTSSTPMTAGRQPGGSPTFSVVWRLGSSGALSTPGLWVLRRAPMMFGRPVGLLGLRRRLLRCRLPLLQQVSHLGGASPQVLWRQVRVNGRTREQVGGVVCPVPA